MRCLPGQANQLEVEPRMPYETSLVLSLRIPDIPCPPRVDSSVQTLGDRGLDDTFSFHLQLTRRPATGMPTAPHPAAQPDQQNVCKPHSERHPPAGSPLAE